MKAAFADTSFYIALANPCDRRHQDALNASNRWEYKVITTEYVLLELGNYFRGSHDRILFMEMLSALRDDSETEIIPASPSLFDQGVILYSRRPDKQWSLTDCISFAVMKACSLTDALACDHHFEQAGYHVILP
jgi:uncharacterized protein